MDEPKQVGTIKPALMQPIAFTVSGKFSTLSPIAQINAELAELLGWANVETYLTNQEVSPGVFAQELHGYPPEAEGVMEAVPNWAGDFQEAAQLMLSQNVSIDLSEETGVTAIVGYRGKGYTAKREKYENHPTKDVAVAFAITVTLASHLFYQKRAAETGTVYPGSRS